MGEARVLQREKEHNSLEGSKLGPLVLLISKDTKLICNTKKKWDKHAGNFLFLQ
jgi:hypothetical protein